MKGKLFYAAVVSLFALLGIFENLILYGLAFLIFCWHLARTGKVSSSHFVSFLVIYIVFSGAGAYAKSANYTAMDGSELEFTIEFTSSVLFDGDRLTSRALILGYEEQVAVRHIFRSDKEAKMIKAFVSPGTVCTLPGSLNQPGQARNPNSFDYSEHLRRNNIHWILNLEEFDLSACSQRQRNLYTSLLKWRQTEVHRLEEMLGDENAAIAAALLFGDRQYIAPDTAASYERNGTVHLLAISGLHVGLLAGMVFYLLLRAGWTRERAEFLLICSLPLYAIVTGLAPSVCRAVLMMMMFLLARRLRLRISSLDILSIALMLLLLISPYSFYAPGFQLSFAVSASLILSSSLIFSMFDSYLSKMAAVSFVAQLASLPILLIHFYEISLISVLANLLFVPLFSFLLLPMVILYYLVSKAMPDAAALILPLLDYLIHFTNAMSKSLAAIPAASLVMGKPEATLLALYLFVIFAFLLGWEKRFKGKWKVCRLLLLAPVIIQLGIPYVSPYGKVVFIDIGQGDSILITLPFNQGNYLIDTGGRLLFEKEGWQKRKKEFDTGRDIVLPYLKSEGIRKLDELILTHGDADHIGGAAALLDELEITQILIPIAGERGELERKVLAMARQKGIDILETGAARGWEKGGNTFVIVSPFEELEDKNEGSIVLWAELGGKSWLFTGDLGESGEEELLQRIPALKAEILKVGHHGSKSSTSPGFLDALAPEVAIISAGDGNLYGHPHLEVMERLSERKIKIYRTDKQGAIIFKFDSKGGTFRPWIP
jgi:competence protein ComEC